MTTDNLQKALELNRAVKDLLTTLGADYEPPTDPRGRSKLAAAFDPTNADTFAGMSDEEVAAWVISDTSKALEAALDAAEANKARPTGLNQLGTALGGR